MEIWRKRIACWIPKASALHAGYLRLQIHIQIAYYSFLSHCTLGLSNSPFCGWCKAGEETSAHVLCECEALASRRHAYLGSFFLEPGDIKSLNLGAIWNYSKAAGLT